MKDLHRRPLPLRLNGNLAKLCTCCPKPPRFHLGGAKRLVYLLAPRSPLLSLPRQTLPPGLPRQFAKAIRDSPVATLPARKTSCPLVVILRTTTVCAVDG